jgi:hypothetical protein
MLRTAVSSSTRASAALAGGGFHLLFAFRQRVHESHRRGAPPGKRRALARQKDALVAVFRRASGHRKAVSGSLPAAALRARWFHPAVPARRQSCPAR